MSAVNCPYDGNFCQKKQMHFDAWQKITVQTDGMAFQLNPDMFAGCPVANPQELANSCDRYRRSLLVIKNTEQSLALSNERQ